MRIAFPLLRRLPRVAGIAAALPMTTLAATPTPTELDRVQVKVSTATRSERLLSDVPIRTEVLRKEDIALRAATDFSRAVELINGLRVESNCQNCNTSEVQLLGLPGAYNQLLFDGIPLLSTLGSVYGLEQIPAGFVDRIEVVKGGGSSLYGPGAVAGVINLIPPLPARSGGHVQAGVDVLKGTPQKNADVRLDLVGREADAGLSVIAQRNWNSGIDYNGDGYTEITRKNLKVGGVQAWYVPNPGTRLRLDLQVTDETRRGGNRLDQPEYLANIAESLDTTYRRGSVSWDQEVNADVDVRLAYAFADIDRDSFYGGLGDVVTDPSAPGYDPSQLDPNVPGSAASRSWRQYGRTHNPLHYIDSQLNWRLGAHTLAFGVQYKHEGLRDDNRDGAGQRLAVLEDATFHTLGAFVQDEWSVRENVDLVLGARVDRNSELDNAVFSPRIALAWQATPNLKWRAGIATGFRAPEIFVEDVHVDTLGGEQVRVRNIEGLREERALTSLFGFDWRSDPAEPVWSWDATASYARIRDTFALGEIQRGDDGQLSQLRYNASGSDVLGMETNLGWQPSAQWRLTAGASWYRSRFREPQRIFDDSGDGGDGGDTVIESRDYLKTPRWTALAQLSWMPAEAWETFFALRHTGPMSVLNNRLGELHRTRAFLVTDLGARWHRHLGAQAQQEVSVAAGVKNVFDQRQKDLEVGALRDSDHVYGPRFARSWYVNLRYAF